MSYLFYNNLLHYLKIPSGVVLTAFFIDVYRIGRKQNQLKKGGTPNGYDSTEFRA